MSLSPDLNLPPQILNLERPSVDVLRTALDLPPVLPRAQDFDQPPSVGVDGLPRGFGNSVNPADATAADIDPALVNQTIVNANFSLEKFWVEGLSSADKYNAFVKQGLLAIALLHNFGDLGGQTNNWLVTPLPPPCDPAKGTQPIPGYNPPSCAWVLQDTQAGVQEFMRHLSDLGLLQGMLPRNGAEQPDADVFTAMAYPIPEVSGIDPTQPLSREAWRQFRDQFWVALGRVASALQTQVAWTRSGFEPSFGVPDGPNGGGVTNAQTLSQDPVERIREAGYLVATQWPSGALPVKDVTQGEQVMQAVLAMALALSSFGLVEGQETNNWFQYGDSVTSQADCTPASIRVFNRAMNRCIYTIQNPSTGCTYAMDAIMLSSRVRDAIYTGDVGKLAYAILMDNWFTPAIPTKDMWSTLTVDLANRFTQIQSALQQPARWSTSNFIPSEFAIQPGGGPNLTCPKDQVLVDGKCQARPDSTSPNTAGQPTAEAGKKSNAIWWILGILALGAGGVAGYRHYESMKSEAALAEFLAAEGPASRRWERGLAVWGGSPIRDPSEFEAAPKGAATSTVTTMPVGLLVSRPLGVARRARRSPWTTVIEFTVSDASAWPFGRLAVTTVATPLRISVKSMAAPTTTDWQKMKRFRMVAAIGMRRLS